MAHEGGFWSSHQGTWNATKLILRSISFVVSIIIIVVSVDVSVRLLEWSDYAVYVLLDLWFALPITFFSIALDGAELAFSFLWKRNPGLPPGWHIGTELALLGGNIVALIFLSNSIPGGYDYQYGDALALIRPLKITTISFVAFFSIVRFVLFVIACVDTHRYHTAAQVEMIVRALRQQNINDPASAALVHNAMHPNRQPIPLQEFPLMQRPSQEPYNKPEFYPELPENQKFLADLPAQLKTT
ncbi:hypothetical protein F4823DRAFT_501635 [Ustulina deusta]|nr:hypothetical protein F4823DRAFT_501635 [Ustulina deusta]